MLKLGIVGAENSHSYRIGEICNIKKSVAMRATMIWGETKKFAKNAAELGQIPEIVSDWKDMLGKVDGIMIDHRHPEPHYEVAKFFIQNKVPVFADKPFTYKLKHARELLDLAEKNKTPVITFSAIARQKTFQKFKKQFDKKRADVKILNSTGPVDVKSKWGGIFFYGIHQVDANIELLGTEIKSAYLLKQSPTSVAAISFKDGTLATINCIVGFAGFRWSAYLQKDVINYVYQSDPNQYLVSAKLIYNLIKKGEVPFTRQRMLAPIAVLEAMEKSLKTGKPVNLPREL